MSTDQHGGDQDATRGRSIAALVGILVVAALVVVWIIINSQRAEVDWLITTTTAPLSVVIIISAVMGWVIGSLTVHMVRRRRKK